MKLSVIVCTYNREEYILRCLNCLKNQSASKSSYEVIVIDNNSKDATKPICEQFQQENSEVDFSYFFEENPGLSFARNRGIKEAKGEIISFIDDDGFAREDYVSEILSFAQNEEFKNYIAFGGKVIPCYSNTEEPVWLSKYIEGLVSKVDLGDAVKDFNKKYPAGCNMIFRKEFFEEHGGFNTDLHTRGDDKFVFDKLKSAGLKVLYIPSVYVEHFIDDYRIERSFIKRMSKVIGQSEYIRLKDVSFMLLVVKFIEYLFKFGASIVLAIGFVLKAELKKAEYILMVRWNVCLGFVFGADKLR